MRREHGGERASLTGASLLPSLRTLRALCDLCVEPSSSQVLRSPHNGDHMIHWLLQSLDDCPEIAGAKAPAGLLCVQEQKRLGTLKIEKRRRDWLLGRWTAKHLVQGYLSATEGSAPALSSIRITNEEDGSPFCELLDAGAGVQRLPVTLSISHSRGHSLCALCRQSEEASVTWSLGCDIEWIEHREQSFVNNFFTAQEIRTVMATPVEQRDMRVTAIWSAKEAVLKSMRTGLRIDTRRLNCQFGPQQSAPAEWTPLTVTVDSELAAQFGGSWYAWWQVKDGFVLTMTLREEGVVMDASKITSLT
jgi:4'-phosphopantetheinyl transferase